MAERHRRRDAGLARVDLLPYSDTRWLRSSTSHSNPRARSMTRRAVVTSRNVFDISPGQVSSLREAPQMSRMRDGVSLRSARRPAAWIRRRVSSHSAGSWNSGPYERRSCPARADSLRSSRSSSRRPRSRLRSRRRPPRISGRRTAPGSAPRIPRDRARRSLVPSALSDCGAGAPSATLLPRFGRVKLRVFTGCASTADGCNLRRRFRRGVGQFS